MARSNHVGGPDTGEGGVLSTYDRLLGPLVDDDLSLLEIGATNESIDKWREFLPHARIVAVGAHRLSVDDDGGRIRVYQGGQQDEALLAQIAEENAPAGFDVIVNRALPGGEYSRTTFWHLLRNHLRSGGIFALEGAGNASSRALALRNSGRIEDRALAWLNARLGEPRRRATRSLLEKARAAVMVARGPQTTMGAIVNEALEECATGEATQTNGLSNQLRSHVQAVEVRPGIAIVRKRGRPRQPQAKLSVTSFGEGRKTAPIGMLLDAAPIRVEFRAQQDGLCGVRFMVGTYARKNAHTLHVALLHDGREVCSDELDASKLADWSWAECWWPRVVDSGGRDLVLQITAEGASKANAISLYHQAEGSSDRCRITMGDKRIDGELTLRLLFSSWDGSLFDQQEETRHLGASVRSGEPSSAQRLRL